MATPIIHSGVAVVLSHRRFQSLSWQIIALSILAANAADFDLIPGFLVGDVHRFHHHTMHSIVLAMAMPVAFAAISGSSHSKILMRTSYKSRYLYFLTLCLSHPILDLLNDNRMSPRIGDPSLALLWPFSSRMIEPRWPLLPSPLLTSDWRNWFIPFNLKIFAHDSVIVLVLFLFSWVFYRYSQKSLGSEGDKFVLSPASHDQAGEAS